MATIAPIPRTTVVASVSGSTLDKTSNDPRMPKVDREVRRNERGSAERYNLGAPHRARDHARHTAVGVARWLQPFRISRGRQLDQLVGVVQGGQRLRLAVLHLRHMPRDLYG